LSRKPSSSSLNRHSLPPQEKIIFSSPKEPRYYLAAAGIFLLCLAGLAKFSLSWSASLPAFLLGSRLASFIALSRYLLGAVFLLAAFILYRDSRGLIILTEKQLLLPQHKNPEGISVPVRQIKSISLGSSPLEKLCRCSSLWITLKKEEEESYLAGPLSRHKAETLKNLLEELLEGQPDKKPAPLP